VPNNEALNLEAGEATPCEQSAATARDAVKDKRALVKISGPAKPLISS
jgi:hypothetical protein